MKSVSSKGTGHEEHYKKSKVVDVEVEEISSLKGPSYRISYFPEKGTLPPVIIQYIIRFLPMVVILIDVLISVILQPNPLVTVTVPYSFNSYELYFLFQKGMVKFIAEWTLKVYEEL